MEPGYKGVSESFPTPATCLNGQTHRPGEIYDDSKRHTARHCNGRLYVIPFNFMASIPLAVDRFMPNLQVCQQRADICKGVAQSGPALWRSQDMLKSMKLFENM